MGFVCCFTYCPKLCLLKEVFYPLICCLGCQNSNGTFPSYDLIFLHFPNMISFFLPLVGFLVLEVCGSSK